MPNASVIGVLITPGNPNSTRRANDLRAAARALRRQIRIFGASSGAELDNAFTKEVVQGTEVLIVQNDVVQQQAG